MQVIHVYTRAQALGDGVLIDVSKLAREAGLRYPTAVTTDVWARYVTVPTAVPWQDETGRLWDIVWMMSVAIRKSSRSESQLFFQLHVCNEERQAELVTLKAICELGDQGEPVITIMLPHED